MTNYNERLDEILDDFFTIGTERHISELKQAITSLIKELVAEAKPYDYVPEGHQPEACLNHEKYTSACCGCQKQRARLQAIDEFEQNLLKALEAEL